MYKPGDIVVVSPGMMEYYGYTYVDKEFVILGIETQYGVLCICRYADTPSSLTQLCFYVHELCPLIYV
jgi:hypothetical protein